MTLTVHVIVSRIVSGSDILQRDTHGSQRFLCLREGIVLGLVVVRGSDFARNVIGGVHAGCVLCAPEPGFDHEELGVRGGEVVVEAGPCQGALQGQLGSRYHDDFAFEGMKRVVGLGSFSGYL
jgi:hypothetical protein